MGSAVGVEFDPHGRVVLYEFRQPAADHEMGREARELTFQVFGLGCEDLDARPELPEGRGDHLPVHGRLVGDQGPHVEALRPGFLRDGPIVYIVWTVGAYRLWNFV